MVQVLIDIDGVLAYGNIPHLAGMYNRLAKLGVDEEQLQGMETEDAFSRLPEVQTHIAAIGPEQYQQRMARMQFHPLYIHELHVMDKALVGVRNLVQRVGKEAVSYCTARLINFNDSWNDHLARVTRLWLKKHDFPCADQVIYCDGIAAKLSHITTMLREQEQPILLIDDSAVKILTALDDLADEDQKLLKQYLTLAAFGYEDVPDECPVPVIPFPHWGEVRNLFVEKEFASYGKQSGSEQSRKL